MNKNNASLSMLDLGSAKPTSVPMETIHVEVSSENLLGDYAKAFIRECFRVNPLRAEQVKLTAEEVERYSEYLLTQRCLSVTGNCPDFRKLKALYIPVWIQYVMSLIGVVTMREIGLTLIPDIQDPSDMKYDEALAISEKISYFEDDLQIVRDAMPRDVEGDVNVMSTALIAGYVRALKPVEHVSATYVTAFLGMKLREETAMAALYRVQYDDVQFIASALTTQRGLF
jgi:hypothetical protein